jgi:hypothetical protein
MLLFSHLGLVFSSCSFLQVPSRKLSSSLWLEGQDRNYRDFLFQDFEGLKTSLDTPFVPDKVIFSKGAKLWYLDFGW